MSVEIGDGRVSRTCEECGVTPSVSLPMRRGGLKAGGAREDYATGIRAQLPWELMCPRCRVWWNDKLTSIDGYLPRAALSDMPRAIDPDAPLFDTPKLDHNLRGR